RSLRSPMTPKLRPVCFLLLAFALAPSAALRAANDYTPHPDLTENPNVPKGEVFKYEFTASKIFPGTVHEVTVYVPKQYDATKPACVHLNQDGMQWKASTVFDNLIARGEMPVVIGIFVRPGIVKALDSAKAQDRFN